MAPGHTYDIYQKLRLLQKLPEKYQPGCCRPALMQNPGHTGETPVWPGFGSVALGLNPKGAPRESLPEVLVSRRVTTGSRRLFFAGLVQDFRLVLGGVIQYGEKAHHIIAGFLILLLIAETAFKGLNPAHDLAPLVSVLLTHLFK